MANELLVSSIAFGLFVVCPRMAGMMHIINKHSKTSILKTVIVGTIISMPLLLLMVFFHGILGIWGAIALCVITDFCAALFMKEISRKAGLETLIIALFVIAGVKVAPIISGLIVH